MGILHKQTVVYFFGLILIVAIPGAAIAQQPVKRLSDQLLKAMPVKPDAMPNLNEWTMVPDATIRILNKRTTAVKDYQLEQGTNELDFGVDGQLIIDLIGCAKRHIRGRNDARALVDVMHRKRAAKAITLDILESDEEVEAYREAQKAPMQLKASQAGIEKEWFTPQNLYTGWILARYPTAVQIEHPVFDITLQHCKIL